jgi:methylated-DNA-[protein]-cysteine S-methyltransferase
VPAYYATVPSPLGDITVSTDGTALTGLTLDGPPPAGSVEDAGRLRPFVAELREYLAGERTEFTFRVEQPGTGFQKRVWDELMTIPYGETISYGELARRVGHPKASRAVGSANGRNQIAIVVPCHRVIASGGTLGGYGGGLWRKEWLLKLEARI